MFAIDKETREWCFPKDASREREYVCGCPEHHRVFLKLPSGKDEVRYVSPHFAHFPVKDRNSNVISSCRGGGESEKHRMAKQKLRDMMGKYTFALEVCTQCCKALKTENCGDGEISIEVRSNDKRWWYDALYKAKDGKCVALEICHTHPTIREKILSSRQNGMAIAEFRADDVLSMNDGDTLENLLAIKIVCDKCKVSLQKAKLHQEKQAAKRKQEEEERAKYNKENQQREAEIERQKRRKRELESNKLLSQIAESSNEEILRQNAILQREERRQNRIAGLSIDKWMPVTIEEAEEVLRPFDVSPYWGPSQSLSRAERVHRVRKFGYVMEGWDWVDAILAKFPELAMSRPTLIQNKRDSHISKPNLVKQTLLQPART
jgi:hypothetical protein